MQDEWKTKLNKTKVLCLLASWGWYVMLEITARIFPLIFFVCPSRFYYNSIRNVTGNFFSAKTENQITNEQKNDE